MSYQVSSEEAAALGRVAVIYGGNSAERDVSLNSGKEILAGLQRAGVDAFGLDLCGPDNSAQPVQQLLEARCDRAFLALHGRGGEDGTLQGVLETLNIPYTGSRVAASALGMDKLRTKQLWQGAGLPTPAWAMINEDTDLSVVARQLGFPMMVKPVHEGSSIGMARVSSIEELAAAVDQAHRFDRYVLAESWMSGAEFTVAVLNGQTLPIIRLETPNEFYDYSAKYQLDSTRYLFDHGLDVSQQAELRSLVLDAFERIGCETWGRVDVMQDEKGCFQLLEVNTAPGMTDHSLVPMAAREQGICFEQLVVEIVRSTLAKSTA
ncbi:MAG: D-alanine--D-alanine ligase [Marinobacterium sp.]|nr:D-alanine--D-alanine ligase [Marinobacterium sp.]